MAITFNHNDQVYVKDGKMGIGTASPQTTLHLSTTGSSTLTIQNTTNSGNATLNFRDESSADQYSIYYALGANRAYNLVNGNGLTIYSSQVSGEIARFGTSTGYTDSYFTGNVGIGTTSPDHKLTVYTDATSGLELVGQDGGNQNSDSSKIIFNGYAQDNGPFIQAVTTSAYGIKRLGFFVNRTASDYTTLPTESISITNTGNVGIGKTDPSAPLHINGGSTNQVVKIQSNSAPYIRFKEGGTDVGFIQFGTDTYISNQKAGTLNFRTNNTDKMTILSGGNVGIGTTSPDEKLSVVGNTGLYGTVSGGIVSPASLRFFTSEDGAGLGDSTDSNKQKIGQITWAGKDTSSNATGEYAAIRTYLIDSNNLIQGSANEGGQIEFSILRHDVGGSSRVEHTAMTINNSANVGIGTTSPNRPLTIETNTSDVLGALKIKNAGSGDASMFFTVNASGAVWQLGIDNSDGDKFKIGQDTQNADVGVGTKLTIDSSGNVGIGTTSPGYKLDVAGDIKASNSYIYGARLFKNDNFIDLAYNRNVLFLGRTSFPNAVANQAVNIELPNLPIQGYFKITLSDSYSNKNITGALTKLIPFGYNANNGIWGSGSDYQITEAVGGVATDFTIGDLAWDATNSIYYIPIYHLSSAGNGLKVRVEYFGESAHSFVDNAGLSSVYIQAAPAPYNVRHYQNINDRLGIAVKTPGARLDVNSNISSSSTDVIKLSQATNGDIKAAASLGLSIQNGGESTNAADLWFTTANGGSLSERMRITSGGNVGIGTTIPQSRLEVMIPRVTDGTRQEIQRFSHLNENSLSVFAYGGATDLIQIGAWNAEQNIAIVTETLSSITATTAKGIYIKSGGNVGIGTTGPAVKLQVSGNASVGNIGTPKSDWWSAFNGIQIGDGTTLWGRASDTHLSSNYYPKDNSGTAQDAYINTSYANDFWLDNSDGTLIYRNAASGTAGTAITWNTRLKILNNGNVGIGTTAPVTKLVAMGSIGFGGGDYNGGVFANSSSTVIDENWGFEVQRTSGVDDYNTRLKYYPVSNGARKAGIYNSLTSSFSLYSDSNNNPNIIIPDGKLGIGTTSPLTKLHVEGGVTINTGNGSSAFNDLNIGGINGWSNSEAHRINFVYGNGTSNIFQTIESYYGGANEGKMRFRNFYTDSQQTGILMTIHSSGNVGIGTDSPSSSLTIGNATDNVAELRVLRSNSLSGTYGFINTVGGTAQIGGSGDTRILSVASSAALRLNTNGVDRLSLFGDGQFWIKLLSTTTGNEAAISNDNDKLRIFGSRHGGTGKYVSIWSDGANENARFYPTNTIFYKNVGIGTTSPGYKLTVDNDDLNTNNPALYVKNPNSSTAALIAEFVGDSDSIQIKNIGTGDYAIYNSQQSNGIALYDGTGGVEIHYNGATVLEADSNGGVKVTGQLSATGDVVAYSSDERLKENIKPIESAVDKIKQLKGVTFDWNEKSEELGFEPSTKTNDVGVIAQDVEAVFPQLVQLAPFDIGSDEDGNATSKSGEDYKTVNYARLTAVLIEAVKEQQQQIDELKAKLDGITK